VAEDHTERRNGLSATFGPLKREFDLKFSFFLFRSCLFLSP
jgi:hypothetical protein